MQLTVFEISPKNDRLPSLFGTPAELLNRSPIPIPASLLLRGQNCRLEMLLLWRISPLVARNRHDRSGDVQSREYNGERVFGL
jgi:hypothetical protein